MFEMGQASVAAALACQKRLISEMAPQDPSTREAPAWPGWFGDWTPVPQAPAPMQTEMMQAWLSMAGASLAFWPGAQQAVAASRAFPGGDSFWPASIPAAWGTTPWALYQGPMMAMMLSYGIPYAVAAPTARASTSAMDAADAACTQWRLVFGNAEGQRAMDRHFAPKSPWSSYLH